MGTPTYNPGTLDWWSAPDLERVYLFEVEAFSLVTQGTGVGAFGTTGYGTGTAGYGHADGPTVGESITSLRFSSRETNIFSDGGECLPVIKTCRVSWRFSGFGFSGLAQIFAEVELINLDGALDSILDSYSFEGRPAKIKVASR